MKPTITDWSWHQTEAADAFVAKIESWGANPEIARAIARIADDTDEAFAIWNFIDDYRRAAGH